MTRFLQVLLLVLSMALCGLVAVQWTREASLHRRLRELDDLAHRRAEAVARAEETGKRLENELQFKDLANARLTENVRTNAAQLIRLTGDLEKAARENERQTRQLEVYKEAMAKANESIARQNEGIQKANGELKKLAEDRNDVVRQLNKVTAEFNALAEKWNRQQEELRRAAAQGPPAK